MDDLENDTRYVKKSMKTTPPKADHKHEYFQLFAMMKLRRFDGTITEKKYKFCGPVICIECDHTVRSPRGRNVVEIEIPPKEFKQKYRK